MIMERIISKNLADSNSKKPADFNGYIVSIQYQGMPPVYSYVPVGSKLESIVSSALKSHPHAIILIQASTDL